MLSVLSRWGLPFLPFAREKILNNMLVTCSSQLRSHILYHIIRGHWRYHTIFNYFGLTRPGCKILGKVLKCENWSMDGDIKCMRYLLDRGRKAKGEAERATRRTILASTTNTGRSTGSLYVPLGTICLFNCWERNCWMVFFLPPSFSSYQFFFVPSSSFLFLILFTHLPLSYPPLSLPSLNVSTYFPSLSPPSLSLI